MIYRFRADESGVSYQESIFTRPRLSQAHRRDIALAALSGHSVTDLARQYGVSRKFVYQQKNIALAAVHDAFSDVKASLEQRVLFEVSMTKQHLEQLVLSMVLCGRSSYRAVQRILEDVFNFHVSLGKIAGIVERASDKASQLNAERDLSPVQAACHDEMFHHDKPLFVAVEPVSRYCLLLKQGYACTTAEWDSALHPLAEQGYAPSYVVADGGKPLRNSLDSVLPNTPCYYDVFHLTREFGRCIGLFRKDENCCRRLLQEHEDRIERFNITEENCPATFDSVRTIKACLDFDAEAIDILRRGIGRTIHKALSLTRPYTYAEREAFYSKTLQSVRRIVTGPTSMRHKAVNLYSLLHCQKDNLLGLFQHEDSNAKIRASSMVENFNFSLRQQLTGQTTVSQNYLDLQRFYLNHRRFLASHAPARIGRSPAELLDSKVHPHWLEKLGYQRL